MDAMGGSDYEGAIRHDRISAHLLDTLVDEKAGVADLHDVCESSLFIVDIVLPLGKTDGDCMWHIGRNGCAHGIVIASCGLFLGKGRLRARGGCDCSHIAV